MRICANQTSYDWFTYPKHSQTLSLSKTTQRNFIRELNEMFDNQNTSVRIIFPRRPLKRKYVRTHNFFHSRVSSKP